MTVPTPEEINRLVDETPIPKGETWRPVDLAPYLAGDYTEDKPSILSRTDGIPLLYPGKLHSLYAEPEGLKSWIALEACRQEMESGNRVVFIDFEDSHRAVISRLKALGVDDELIATRFTYIRPSERLGSDAWEHVEAACAGASLVVLDGMTEAMVMEGLNLNDNSDVASFLEALPRRIARLGPAVLILDHVGRDKEARGRFAIGAQAKLAGLDGAAFSIHITDPFGRNKTGRARLNLRKDRVGYVSEHSIGDKRDIAEVVATSDGERVRIELNPPLDPSEWRPTRLMESISALIETMPGCSGRQIEQHTPGKAEWVRKATAALVADGYVRIEPGPYRATLHYLIKPYKDGET